MILSMTAFHNGKQISDGNMKDMDWTFAEIIERASYGVELLPGDVIGSGTVGTGCYLELNGTQAIEAKAQGKEFTPVWLKEGDTVELEITDLGKLTNKIVKASKDYSILAKNIKIIIMCSLHPKDLPVPEIHQLLLGGIGPRPIALVQPFRMMEF